MAGSTRGVVRSAWSGSCRRSGARPGRGERAPAGGRRAGARAVRAQGAAEGGDSSFEDEFERNWRPRNGGAASVEASSSSGRTDLYETTPRLAECIERLASVETSPALVAGDFTGVWEVVYMPHIYKTRALGVRFRPVRYSLVRTGEFSYGIVSEGARTAPAPPVAARCSCVASDEAACHDRARNIAAPATGCNERKCNARLRGSASAGSGPRAP